MNKLPTLGLLSATDGRLMSDIGDVYKVISFFIGRAAYTHELPMYSRKAGPMIASRFPGLAGDRNRHWRDLRDAAVARFGNEVEVPSDWHGTLADGRGPMETLTDAISEARGEGDAA